MSEFSAGRAELFEPFVKFRIASDSWSETSSKNLKAFDRYCTTNYPGEPGLTQEMITGWCSKRPTENNKNSMLTRCNVCISLIKYLIERELIEISAPDMPKHKKWTHIPHAFTDKELEKYFEQADKFVMESTDPWQKFVYLSIAVLSRLLYSSGMRTTEVRLLKAKNVDLRNGIINIVDTKGNMQHFVALHDDALEMLVKYDKVANRKVPSRLLFFPIYKKDVSKPISNSLLDYYFHRIWYKVNTAKAVPYDFRHNYATNNINSWLDSGIDFHSKFMYLSKSMGHSSLESTRYYYSIVPALAAIIKMKSETNFNDICPEVPVYEQD